MSNYDEKVFSVERFRVKRPVGRPPLEHPMRQLAIRIPDNLLEAIDSVILEREGQCDRATVIREAIARGLKQM